MHKLHNFKTVLKISANISIILDTNFQIVEITTRNSMEYLYQKIADIQSQGTVQTEHEEWSKMNMTQIFL